jgi:hypothetical protein
LSHALWVAVCAASLVFHTTQLMQLPFNIYLAAFVFFATLCSYNFHYLLAGAFQQQKFSIALIYTRFSAVLVLLAGIAGMIFFYADAHIKPNSIAIAFLLTFIYSIPLMPFKMLAFTRKAGILKTLLLAFTWMFVTAYLPLAQYELQFTATSLLIMAKRLLFMLMLCILFDNRDINIDKIHGFSSLATHLSSVQMKWLIYSIFVLLFILNFSLGHYGITAKQVAALQLAAFINLVIH